MINLDELEITYRWSPRRKTIGLVVTTDGKLTVAAPRGASRAQIAQAIERHRAWIEAKTAERQAAWARLQDGVAFFLGDPYRLALTTRLGNPVELAGGEIRVPAAGGNGLWPLLRAWYGQEAERVIPERVHHFAPRLRLAPGRVELRDWKRRWGECHPGIGALRFNWRLIMLPLPVLDYVVVHELTHLRVPGHTPEFWRQVGKTLPDYGVRRAWLNHYGAPFLIWQAS